MAIVDLFVKSGSSLQLSADDATVQHQMALLLHGDYTIQYSFNKKLTKRNSRQDINSPKWAWLSFSAASPPIYSLLGVMT